MTQKIIRFMVVSIKVNIYILTYTMIITIFIGFQAPVLCYDLLCNNLKIDLLNASGSGIITTALLYNRQ